MLRPRLARDALDVLAPLADSFFGLNQLKTDLEDAAFERLAPKAEGVSVTRSESNGRRGAWRSRRWPLGDSNGTCMKTTSS